MQQTSLGDLLHVLRLRWRMIAIVTFVMMVSAVLAGLWLLRRTYVADVSLRTPTEQPRINALAQLLGPGMGFGVESPTADYVQIVASRKLAERVVSELKLKDFLGKETTTAAAIKLQDAVTASDRGNVIHVNVKTVGTVRGFSRVPTDVNEAGRAVGADVEAREMAADIANAYAHVLQAYLEQESLTTQRRTLEFVRAEREKARAELAEALLCLQAFQEKHGTVALTEETSALVNVVSELGRDERMARAALAEVSASLDRARERQAEIGTAEGLELPASTDLLKTLYDQYVQKQTDLAVSREELTDRHPKVQELQSELAQLDARIAEEKARIKLAAHEELDPRLVDLAVNKAGAAARSSSLNAAVASLKGQLDPVPALQRQWAELKLEVQTKQGLYEVLTNEEAQAEIEERREGTWAQVLDRAVPPLEPVSPRLKLILVLAFAVGLMFSTTWAFVAEALAAARGPQVVLGDEEEGE